MQMNESWTKRIRPKKIAEAQNRENDSTVMNRTESEQNLDETRLLKIKERQKYISDISNRFHSNSTASF